MELCYEIQFSVDPETDIIGNLNKDGSSRYNKTKYSFFTGKEVEGIRKFYFHSEKRDCCL